VVVSGGEQEEVTPLYAINACVKGFVLLPALWLLLRMPPCNSTVA
jgi:hypothetical protein